MANTKFSDFFKQKLQGPEIKVGLKKQNGNFVWAVAV